MATLYRSSVADTTAPPRRATSVAKRARVKNQSMTVPKMCVSMASLSSVKHRRRKWRRRRGGTKLRPPPGRPIAAATTASSTALNSFSARSYQPPWSTSCRSSSSGGMAPHFSGSGRFTSSTNTMHVWPGGGPYTPRRRLSSFTSTMPCVAAALVRAENATNTGM